MERLPFVRKFQWKFSVSGMVLVLFWYRKQEERDWGVPFTKYRLNSCFLSSWSVAIVIQTNGTENFGRFCKTWEKGYASKGITFFQENFPPGWTVPFEFSTEFLGFPYKALMISLIISKRKPLHCVSRGFFFAWLRSRRSRGLSIAS